MPEPQHPAARRLVSLLVATSTIAAAASADPLPGSPAATAARRDEQKTVEPSRWREGVARLESLWVDTRSLLRDETPDWRHLKTRRDPTSTLRDPDSGHAYVVLQEDRADGMDLVTLRYAIAEQGALHTYAGAGLNHAQYFMDGTDAGSTLLTRRNPRSAVGPTAELGAELALNDRVSVNADLRWADLDERENLLRGAYGPVAADPVTLGLSIGYRFR
jgi:hypothetical protein